MDSLKDEINKQTLDVEFKQKLIELNRTAKHFNLYYMLNLFKDQKKLQKLTKKLIVLKSEISISYIKGVWDRLFNVRVGKEMYFQKVNYTHLFQSQISTHRVCESIVS